MHVPADEAKSMMLIRVYTRLGLRGENWIPNILKNDDVTDCNLTCFL